MANVIKFNPLPVGNAGGLIHRFRDSRPQSLISVFVPPFKAEVTLNVPSCPRSLEFNSQGLPLVMSEYAHPSGVSTFYLRAAQRTESGIDWSPFFYANVFEDASICWGAKNTPPTTMLGAWDQYWTSPFNLDLAPNLRNNTSRERWEMTVEGTDTMRRTRALFGRARAWVDRVFTDAQPMWSYESAVIGTDAFKAANLEYLDAEASYRKAKRVRERAFQLGYDQWAAETPGYYSLKFPEEKYPAVVRARALMDRYEIRLNSADRKRNETLAVGREYVGARNALIAWWVRRALILHSYRRLPRFSTNAIHRCVVPGSENFHPSRLARACADLRSLGVPGHKIRADLRTTFAFNLDDRVIQAVNEATNEAYLNWRNQQRSSYAEHFQSEWTHALVLRPMVGDIINAFGPAESWTSEQFGPCHVIANVPVGLLPTPSGCPLPPSSSRKYAFPGEVGGKAVTVVVLGFFHYLPATRRKDRLWQMSYPGMEPECGWVTNGFSVVLADDAEGIKRLRKEDTSKADVAGFFKDWTGKRGVTVWAKKRDGGFPVSHVGTRDPLLPPNAPPEDEDEGEDETDNERCESCGERGCSYCEYHDTNRCDCPYCDHHDRRTCDGCFRCRDHEVDCDADCPRCTVCEQSVHDHEVNNEEHLVCDLHASDYEEMDEDERSRHAYCDRHYCYGCECPDGSH